ncbi:MAG: hypothetical protein JKY50_07275 [Oleispira sp.]|nr:hypothetical protein [Oleispira sp.]MBL4881198.1 hypothetical protein [Oleispira sp.]
MTTELAPLISIEHIHATLLTEIKYLMERSKSTPTTDHSMILNFQANLLISVFYKLVAPALNSKELNAFEAIKLAGQLADAATIQEEATERKDCA